MRCGNGVFLDLNEGVSHFPRMHNFEPIESSLRFTRNDKADPRLGERIADQISSGVAIVGYPDDEGVRKNGGREGAKLGPSEIRKFLYRMTPHPQREMKSFTDLGNLQIRGELKDRHAQVSASVSALLAQNLQVLSFGGGNDYAFADGEAFLKSGSQKPLIINVDAHFDVRNLDHGLTSGTPFYRLLESGHEFDFFEFGIQTHCNSRTHWDYVSKKGGRILTMDEILDSGTSLSECVTRKLEDWLIKRRPTFLAIDMDAFAYPYAAGTSAAWPVGLLPHDFLPVFNTLLRRLDVKVLGLYEVAPQLDFGIGTAKLAAQLAHGYLHHV